MSKCINQAFGERFALYEGDSCELIRELPENSVGGVDLRGFGLSAGPNFYTTNQNAMDVLKVCVDAETKRGQ